jgi:hypothetical protein
LKTSERATGGKSANSGQFAKCSNAQESAGMLLAIVAGFQMMRQMMRLEVLADADPAILANLLTSIFATVLGRRASTSLRD